MTNKKSRVSAWIDDLDVVCKQAEKDLNKLNAFLEGNKETSLLYLISKVAETGGVYMVKRLIDLGYIEKYCPEPEDGVFCIVSNDIGTFDDIDAPTTIYDSIRAYRNNVLIGCGGEEWLFAIPVDDNGNPVSGGYYSEQIKELSKT